MTREQAEDAAASYAEANGYSPDEMTVYLASDGAHRFYDFAAAWEWQSVADNLKSNGYTVTPTA